MQVTVNLSPLKTLDNFHHNDKLHMFFQTSQDSFIRVNAPRKPLNFIYQERNVFHELICVMLKLSPKEIGNASGS